MTETKSSWVQSRLGGNLKTNCCSHCFSCFLIFLWCLLSKIKFYKKKSCSRHSGATDCSFSIKCTIKHATFVNSQYIEFVITVFVLIKIMFTPCHSSEIFCTSSVYCAYLSYIYIFFKMKLRKDVIPEINSNLLFTKDTVLCCWCSHHSHIKRLHHKPWLVSVPLMTLLWLNTNHSRLRANWQKQRPLVVIFIKMAQVSPALHVPVLLSWRL